MKTIVTIIAFFIVQSKENCGDYYQYTATKGGETYVIYSTTNYNVKDSIFLKK